MLFTTFINMQVMQNVLLLKGLLISLLKGLIINMVYYNSDLCGINMQRKFDIILHCTFGIQLIIIY